MNVDEDVQTLSLRLSDLNPLVKFQSGKQYKMITLKFRDCLVARGAHMQQENHSSNLLRAHQVKTSVFIRLNYPWE